jgi:hypothetical protein
MAAILTTALAAPDSSSRAAEGALPLRLTGAIRLRQESLWNQYRPGFPDRDDQLVLRSNVRADWAVAEGWTLVGELMDSRAWENGDDGVLSSNEVNVFEPIQAYVARDLREPFGKGSSLNVQLGRFTANLGSRRLVASDDYRNTPNSYTGVRADVKLASKATANFFYVLPAQRRPDDAASLRDQDFHLDREGREQQLWGVVASRPGLLPGKTLAEVTYVGFKEQDHGARATRNRDLDNFGLRAILDPATGKWDYELEGIYQTGNVRSGTAAAAPVLDVDAYFLHADLGYTFASQGKPHLSAEYDYVSGDSPAADYTRFDTLFGMRRSDFAPSGIYGLLGRANVESLGLRIEAAPAARYDLLATWHLLWAADGHDSFSTSGIRDASGAAGSYAGQQFDARVRYWILPQKLRAEVNAVWFIRGDLMRDAPNASTHGDPRYVSAAVSYSF